MAVSSTSVRGFFARRSLSGDGEGQKASLEFIIDASVTLTIGDAVRVDTAGYLKRATTGQVPAGILVGIVDQFGVNIFSPRASGTTGSTLTPGDTIAVSSTNTSDTTRNIKGQVLCDTNGDVLLFNNANNTGLTVANLMQYYQVASGGSGQIDTTTNSNTNGQFQLVVLNPDGDGVTSKGLFRVSECQFTNNASNYGTSAIRLA